MRIVLILSSAVLLIAFADAQRKPNMTKPVVDLEKRSRPPVWNRPPEERRKLSIFPKNSIKFVVTPKTVVKNDDTAKEGLPTKRPLMRTFTMQDRNEKGTWSFAPREPLMKTNRFSVTLAPPKSNRKVTDETISKESKKVNTVLSNAKIGQPSAKNRNLNKGNLIDKMQIKKITPQASKNKEKVENRLTGEQISVNDSRNFDIIQMNDNSRSKPDKVSKDYAIDISSLDDEDIILNANETKNESNNVHHHHHHQPNEHGSIKFNQAATLDTELSKHLLESRAVDLNKLKYAIEPISGTSNNYTEERSNESLTDTGEEISKSESESNESSSIMAGEDLSNETSSLTEEISEEHTMETSDNFTGQAISNESSSNMAGEEISNETYPDKSINLTEEISDDLTETSDFITGEVISNESSSNTAGEEISSESYPDKSINLTEEISDELMETSDFFTGEVISNESDKSYNLTEEISSEPTVEMFSSLIDDSHIRIDVRISDKSADSLQEPEILQEALTNRFKRSNNIIEEEILPTTVSGFKIKHTGNEITLNHDLSYKNINA